MKKVLKTIDDSIIKSFNAYEETFKKTKILLEKTAEFLKTSIKKNYDPLLENIDKWTLTGWDHSKNRLDFPMDSVVCHIYLKELKSSKNNYIQIIKKTFDLEEFNNIHEAGKIIKEEKIYLKIRLIF